MKYKHKNVLFRSRLQTILRIPLINPRRHIQICANRRRQLLTIKHIRAIRADIRRIGQKIAIVHQLLLIITAKPRTTTRRIAYIRRRSHTRTRYNRARSLIILFASRASSKLWNRVLYGDHELFKRATSSLLLFFFAACWARAAVGRKGRRAGWLSMMSKTAILLQVLFVQKYEIIIARERIRAPRKRCIILFDWISRG